MCVHMSIYAKVPMWRSVDKFQELVLSTMWVLEIKRMSLGLGKVSLPSEPSQQPFLKVLR